MQSGAVGVEPGPVEVARALERHVEGNGVVSAGVAKQLREEHGWSGRTMDVFDVLTTSADTMSTLTGGRRPDEIVTWLSVWVDSPLSVEEIRLVVASGGWDPEPFGVIARAGLLEALLRCSNGAPRRVHNESAGVWVSDELALSTDAEILERVHRVLDAG